MLDISFSELLIFVTGAGLLLGRKELVLAAKISGNSLGRIVGTLHGLKANYEMKSSAKHSDLKTLHSSVRTGLRDLSTVGYDLMSVSPMRMMSSPLGMTQHYNSNIPVQYPNVPLYDPALPASNPNSIPVYDSNAAKSMYMQAQQSGTMSPAVIINPLDGRTSSTTGTFATVPYPEVRRTPSEEGYQATAVNHHFSRIILAERDLNFRMEHEATIYKNKAAPTSEPAQEGGADLVHSVISECILANTYR